MEYPSALILTVGEEGEASNVIRRISLKKIRVHESAYCKEPVRSKKHLKEMMATMFTEDMRTLDQLKPVQSIEAFRQPKSSFTEAQEKERFVVAGSGGVLPDLQMKDVATQKSDVFVPDYARVEELEGTVSDLDEGSKTTGG